MALQFASLVVVQTTSEGKLGKEARASEAKLAIGSSRAEREMAIPRIQL